MILYTGEPMHDPDRSNMIPWCSPAVMEAIRAWQRRPHTERLSDADRCVNEEAPGCAGKAEANGWCKPCWATISPPEPASAVSEPFETGCGRR